MFKSHLLKASAVGVILAALLTTSLPAHAQDDSGRGGWSQRTERAEQAAPPRRGEFRNGDFRNWRREPRGEPAVQTRSPVVDQAAQSRGERRSDYGANRDGSYGAYARRDRRDERAERREDARESRQDFRRGWRAGQDADQRSDRDAWRQGYRQGRREDWRDDRRDVRQAYNRGYRAGDRSDDGRWGQRDHRRWDNRGWRNDHRYDWYRYRAANRAIFRPGRYYAPFHGYRYSRIGIGFRLGSPFYSNRYWINDPWHYRLPPAYGPYRWVRYYDDALLVDIYSGQVVDVIHDFFW